MERNYKRKRCGGDDLIIKKVKEEQVERRNFYDVFFFDEGLVCDIAEVKVEAEQQTEDRFVGETSDDETTTKNLNVGDDFENENDNKEETNVYEDTDEEDRTSIASSGTISADEKLTDKVQENALMSSSEDLKGEINLGEEEAKISDTDVTSKGAILKNDNPAEEVTEKPISTSSESSPKVKSNKGKAKKAKNRKANRKKKAGENTVQGGLGSSTSTENRLDKTEIFSDPLCPFREVLHSNLACIKWLQGQGLVPSGCKCPECGLDMEFTRVGYKFTHKGYMWLCRMIRRKGEYHPNVRISVLRGTIFSRSRLSIRQVLIIIYYFTRNRINGKFLENEMSIEGFKTSSVTVADYLLLCRQLCQMWLLDNCDKNRTLGSRECPVEVVECDVARNSPTLTLCLVEHNLEYVNYIVDSCPERNSDSVRSMVLKYVNGGTVVVTELFKTFSNHEYSKYSHFEVDLEKRRLNPLVRQRCVLRESVLMSVKKDYEIVTDPLCPFREVLHSNLACIKWLQGQGLVPSGCKCPECGLDMEFKRAWRHKWTHNGYTWLCKKIRRKGEYHPNVRISVFRGTLFSRSRLSPRQVLIIIYYFTKNRKNGKFLENETSIEGFKTSNATVADYLLLCRQLCLMWLLDNCDKNHTLGSRECLVEVVECDVARNSPTLTLCLVEHNLEYVNYIVVSCPERNSESVTSMVLKYVNGGTVVVTELFKTFSNHEYSKYSHFEVDREKRRLNPLVRQRCVLKESVLMSVKKDYGTSGINSNFLYTHLSEFLYRGEVKRKKYDPFWHFIHIIRTYYPVK